MKEMLRTPLIKSAILLGFILLLAFITATSPEGSIWNSIGVILIGLLRTLQMGVGLILALVLCLFVLAAIFLGGAALVSRENAAAMYGRLRDDISSGGAAAADQMKSMYGAVLKRDSKTSPNLTGASESIRAELDGLAGNQRRLATRLEEQNKENAQMGGRLRELGELSGKQAEMTAGLEESVRLLDTEMKRLASALELLTGRMSGLEDGNRQTVSRLEGIEDLKNSFAVLQDKVDSLIEESARAESRSGESSAAEEPPRLFNYIDDPAERQRLDQFMHEIGDREMTQAQIIDYLMEQAGQDLGAIIEAHPSLVRDYIRDRRR